MTTTTDIGFRPQKSTAEDEAKAYERMKYKVLEEVKTTFRPEFLNRVDEVVVFHQLTREQIEAIVTLELEKVIREVRAQEMELKVTEAGKLLLARKGWDPQFGARPLRRAIQRMVEDPLSEKILWKEFHAGDTIVADADGEEIVFRTHAAIEPPPVELAGSGTTE